MKFTLYSTALLAASCLTAWAGNPGLGSFIVTNDDLGPPFPNTATFFTLNADGTLSNPSSVETGGNGIGGGFFAAHRIIVVPVSAGDACVFAANALDNDIGAIDAATRAMTGIFAASASDVATGNGIGMAANSKYLYATYSTSSTIATFSIQPGCTLTYVGDLLAVGLNGGYADGMDVTDTMMVVTYGDGSIESFDISGGMPVSHGDQQYSSGAANDHLPNGVIITHDGHFAIFGDSSTRTAVEVSDLSSGKLAPTVEYDLGPSWNSGNVRLSPDEQYLFVSNNSVGQVTAAYFNHNTGKITRGCSSPSLKGYYSKYSYVGNIVFQNSTGAGGLLYLPEFSSNAKQLIGVVQFSSSNGACTLTEAPNSPVVNPQFSTVLSIAAYPTVN